MKLEEKLVYLKHKYDRAVVDSKTTSEILKQLQSKDSVESRALENKLKEEIENLVKKTSN